MSSWRVRTKAKTKAPAPHLERHPYPHRGYFLGFVGARDVKAAEAVATRAYALTEYQPSRLVVRERV